MRSMHATFPSEFVSVVATEIASGVDTAVESWMAEIENALHDNRLTTLGRMNAVQDILAKYKQLTGKRELHCTGARPLGLPPSQARLYGR